MKIFVAIVLSWTILLSPTVQAASFDCAKAATKIEKFICRDAGLSKLDEDLNKAYLKLLERNDVKQQAVRNQKQWLKDVRNTSQSVECLKNAYATRIKEINSLSSSTTTSDSPSEKSVSIKSVCQAVVDAANKRKLGELIIDTNKVDINNDGLPERVMVVDEGSMHWQHFEAYSENGKPVELKKSAEDDWESENLRFALDPSLIKYNGKTFILGKTEDNLFYLSQVNQDNVEKVVCEFSRRSLPIESLTTSKNNKLCQLALKQQFNYVDFDQESELTYETIQDAGAFPNSSVTPTDMAAQVDINNDGKSELVVGLEMVSGGGRGCSGEQLGVLNKDRDNLDLSTTQLLPESDCGGMKQNPFVFEGLTYIEILSNNVHQIAQLKKEQLETVCEFDVHVMHDVVKE